MVISWAPSHPQRTHYGFLAGLNHIYTQVRLVKLVRCKRIGLVIARQGFLVDVRGSHITSALPLSKFVGVSLLKL